MVNALIHADFSGQGGIVIDRYANRFELSNPGTLLVSHEQILRGSVGECRNKALQRCFRCRGGDKAGSGIDKIRRSWTSEQWHRPSIQERLRPDRVRLMLPMVSLLPADTVQELRGRFGAAFEELNRDEVQAVVTPAALNDEITNQRLQEILTPHRVDITKLLQGFGPQGPAGTGRFRRGTRYALPGPEVAENSLVSEGNSLVGKGSSLVSEGSSLVSKEGAPAGLQDMEALIGKVTWFRACPDGGRRAGNSGSLFGTVRSLGRVGRAAKPKPAAIARICWQTGRARSDRIAVPG